MKKHFKRFMAWILVLTMILGSNTTLVFAEEFTDGTEEAIFLDDESTQDVFYEEPVSDL